MIVEKQGYLCGGIQRKDVDYSFSCPMDGVAQDWVFAGGRLFNVHLPNRRRDGIFGIRWEEKSGARRFNKSLLPVLEALREIITESIEDMEWRCKNEAETLLKLISLDWDVSIFNRYQDALRVKWALKKAPLEAQLEAVDNWFK
tara:strand:- start:767 stop:1198 length:432 start_codon:yes stop_codon:yes gene_type:complete